MSLPKNNHLTNAIELANLPEGHVIAKSVAIQELKPFIEYHQDRSLTDEEITDGYPDVLIAIERGMFDLSNPDAPVLTLKSPFKLENGEVVRPNITFKTRMKASVKESLFKGVNIAQEQQKYMNISKAYFCGLPTKSELDAFGKFDEKVTDQIISLFI